MDKRYKLLIRGDELTARTACEVHDLDVDEISETSNGCTLVEVVGVDVPEWFGNSIQVPAFHEGSLLWFGEVVDDDVVSDIINNETEARDAVVEIVNEVANELLGAYDPSEHDDFDDNVEAALTEHTDSCDFETRIEKIVLGLDPNDFCIVREVLDTISTMKHRIMDLESDVGTLKRFMEITMRKAGQ